MSTTYAGQPGNEVLASYLVVSTTTGAAVSPIVVTTTAPHGLQAGEIVQITDVAGNTAANGIWYVSPTGLSTIALYSGWDGGTHLPTGASTGNGAYSASGKVQPLAWATSATLPSDGDALSAASVNTPMEGQIDRTAKLIANMSAYRMVKTARVYKSALTPTTSTGLTNSPAAGLWAEPAALNLALYGGAYASMYFDAWDSDVFEVSFTGYESLSGGGTPKFALRLAYEMQDYGVAFTGIATAGLQGSSKYFTASANVSLYTKQSISSGTRGKRVIFLLQDWNTSGTPTYDFLGDVELCVTQWRS